MQSIQFMQHSWRKYSIWLVTQNSIYKNYQEQGAISGDITDLYKTWLQWWNLPRGQIHRAA